MIFPDDDLDIHPELAGPAQNFEHPAGAALQPRREASDLDVDDRAVQFVPLRRRDGFVWPRRGNLLAAWNDDLMRDSGIERKNVVGAVAVMEFADNGFLGAVEHP